MATYRYPAPRNPPPPSTQEREHARRAAEDRPHPTPTQDPITFHIVDDCHLRYGAPSWIICTCGYKAIHDTAPKATQAYAQHAQRPIRLTTHRRRTKSLLNLTDFLDQNAGKDSWKSNPDWLTPDTLDTDPDWLPPETTQPGPTKADLAAIEAEDDD